MISKIVQAGQRLSPVRAPNFWGGLTSCVSGIDPGAALISIVYVVLYALFIIRGHGVPYVMDNNETFSALLHAHNLWTFDFFQSFGLTDESTSPAPEGHPFAHTHQGNFPRLFAVVLYALGARSAESQIWITTMTIGAASVLMAYVFLRRLAGSLFAATAVLLLMSDYLMFAQWQVNIYRVWTGFLLFAALLCVHGLSEWRGWRWAAATILTYAALFYGELVFATFVSLAVGFYTIWTYRRSPRLIVIAALVQGTAAALALTTLAVQLVLFLGWQDILTDLRYTVTARNYAPGNPEFVSELRQFYESKSIVFWYNVQSDGIFAGILNSLRWIFRLVLQEATPFLNVLGIGMAVAALCADSRRPGPQDIDAIAPNVSVLAILLLVPGVFLLILSIAGGDAVVGLPFSGIEGGTGTITVTISVFLLLAVVVAVGLRSCATWISISGAPPGIYRSGCAGLFLSSVGILILGQGSLYEQGAVILWWTTLTLFPVWLAKVVVCTMAFAGCMLVLAGRRATLGRWHSVPSSLAPFLISGVLSYVVVYKLSGGYIISGYFVRLCPFITFHFEAFLALGLFAAMAMSLTLLGGFRKDFNNRVIRAAGVAAATATAAFLGGWIFVQARYVQLLPPDAFQFASFLKEPGFRGQGLITNNYSSPFGYLAKTWAYTEADSRKLASGSWTQDVPPQIDYFWLADRRTNASYLRPDLYVCFIGIATLRACLESS